MELKDLSAKVLIIIAVMISVACLSVSVNNSWKIPNTSLSISIQREKSSSVKNTYTRTLTLEENYTTKSKLPLALENGDYSRANVYRTSDKTYAIRDFQNDYEINTETKTIKKFETPNRTNGGEYIGTFDENESGGWRYIPAAERKEIPVGEIKSK